ncbi:SMI1/KNR4 family protein [Nocardia sp. 2]|uniref:SMI1/KNR4 family protein n=1 Tax=Nocardia acididurans TaxID=2802282 RepID=A0ABS1MK22_9NOCA|nr:SMI1/KNR4 family protein [Nocardia acididurans]MBL1080019.1 SMI1/KNR4 family protein [Nocardia acididurans]
MAAPVGSRAWRELLDQMVVERVRLAAADEYERPLTLPRPGATEAELRAAEERLGHSLDPHYRVFLSVADGWDSYFIGSSLLGTADIGAGERWVGATNTLKWFMENSSGYFAEGLGIPDDSTVCQAIGDNDNGYSNHLYLLLHDTSGSPAGGVFPLEVDQDTIWPDLYSYLSHLLPSLRSFADSAELGPHSDAWGRDIRRDPPAMADIVARIAELSALAYPEASTVISTGATPETLDALDRELGRALHPEHRELLSAANGMTTPEWTIGRVLSVEEIRDGVCWDAALTRAQQIQDDHYRVVLGYLDPAPEPKPPARERINRIAAVPFAVWGGKLFGVNIGDGRVLDLLDDMFTYGQPIGPHRSFGTVREHLLTACDHLWLLAHNEENAEGRAVDG